MHIKGDSLYKLKKCLEDIKIKEDIVLIHSSLIPFKIKPDEVEFFCDFLIKKIGKDKTIIMPTFTFSFGFNKTWNYNSSKSEAGILTEYFRKNFSECRTIHPIHSVCIYNNKYELKHECESSFGQGSVWEWISNNDVCNLSLGIGLNGGATICHYPEESLGVDYRTYITLDGKIYDEKNNFFCQFIAIYMKAPFSNC